VKVIVAAPTGEPVSVFKVPDNVQNSRLLGATLKVRIVGVGDDVVNPEEPELGDRDEDVGEDPELGEGFGPPEPDSSSVT